MYAPLANIHESPIFIDVAAEILTPGLNKQNLPASIFPSCLSAFQVVIWTCASGDVIKVAKSPTDIFFPDT